MFKEKFKVENFVYLFEVNEMFEVSFKILNGTSKRGSFKNENEYSDLDISINPLKVLNKVSKIFINFVYTFKPPMLSFSTDSNKKFRVYEKLLNRYLRNSNIEKEYFINSYHNTFYFTKLN